MVSSKPFGSTADGRRVTVYELTAGKVHIRVMDFGATLLGVECPDSQGTMGDILLGFDSIEGYFDDPACYGCTIGPSANRTDKGEVTIAGTSYQLPQNDGPKQANNLHTDLQHGLHKRLWDARVDEQANAVTFTCRLANGELGLPGNRTFTARFALDEGDGGAVLHVDYGCTTDAQTFVNMTNHSYFNLTGHDTGSVHDQLVQIEADAFLPLREDNVSCGEVRPVENTAFDFRTLHALGERIEDEDPQLVNARGYDHCFCVRGFEPDGSPRPALHAEDPVSGRTLDIAITAPGAHLYTGNWLDDSPAKAGAAYAPRCGFAFEPEFYPDNMHHAEWPHPVCTPEHPYRSSIAYRFGTK